MVAIEVNQSFDEYRFDQVAQSLYAFVWDEFCNWYLEIAKIELADTSIPRQQHLGIRQTLLAILDGSLRLLHPLMPFITEALWQEISSRTGQPKVSIMTQPYPSGDLERINQRALSEITWIQDVVSGLRNIRGEMNIDPNRRIPVLLQGGDPTAQAYLERFHHLLIELAHLESLEEIAADSQPPESATVLVGSMKVLVPLGSIIERGTELKRLEREI